MFFSYTFLDEYLLVLLVVLSPTSHNFLLRKKWEDIIIIVEVCNFWDITQKLSILTL